MPNYFDDLADIGDDDLGALGFPFRRRAKRGRSVPARRLLAAVPGVPARGLREQALPMGATAFTASSGTALTLTVSPQRPFRGRRLILDLTRTGTSATGLVSITQLLIGANNQLPVATGAMPAAAFSATAVGVNLDMDPAQPGVTVALGIQISAAPTMTDRVDAAAVIIGQSAS